MAEQPATSTSTIQAANLAINQQGAPSAQLDFDDLFGENDVLNDPALFDEVDAMCIRAEEVYQRGMLFIILVNVTDGYLVLYSVPNDGTNGKCFLQLWACAGIEFRAKERQACL